MISVIETHDLCKSYNGRIVVEHLNLSVPQGCVYGFLGPNGAGKSTSMKILLGLVHPTSGSVKLLGDRTSDCRRKPQSRAVLSWHETETWHCNGITWQSQAADPG